MESGAPYNRDAFQGEINKLIRRSPLPTVGPQQHHVLLVSWAAARSQSDDFCRSLRDKIREYGYNVFTYADIVELIENAPSLEVAVEKIVNEIDMVAIICRKTDVKDRASRLCVATVEAFDTTSASSDRLRFYVARSIDNLPTDAFTEPISPRPADHRRFDTSKEALKKIGEDIRNRVRHHDFW